MRTLIIWLTFAAAAVAQNRSLGIPDEVEVGRRIVASCNCPVPEGGFLRTFWRWSEGLETHRMENDLAIWGPPGRYSVSVIAFPMEKLELEGRTIYAIIGEPYDSGSSYFTITGKVDPQPPGPEPPDPEPPPDTAPFPAPGLVVLIIHENSEAGLLPISQLQILQSQQFRAWCVSQCVRIDNTPGLRIWDDDYTDNELSSTPDVFKVAYRELLQDAAGRLPWIGISNGKTGYSGPLPMTIDDTKSLIARYK